MLNFYFLDGFLLVLLVLVMGFGEVLVKVGLGMCSN